MITRIIIAFAIASFVSPVAFGQMKYSRANSQKPTPTPTPTPAAKTAPVQALPQRPTPMQMQQPPTMPRKTTAVQTQPLASPQKTTLAPAQSPAPQQRTTWAPRTTPVPLQQKALPTPAPTFAKPTPTPVPPPDIKAYLDRQVASSKDQKFNFAANGKDLALTPFHVWAQKSTGPNSTSTCIDMRSEDGRIYDIDFATTGAQVTGIRIHRINGESSR